MTTRTEVNEAWGVAGPPGKAVCVRLSRLGNGYRAQRVDESTGRSGGQPLVLCLADEAVFYRAIALPDAEPAVLEKLVQRQLEAMVPVPADTSQGAAGRFATCWTSQSADGGQRRVLLCAVRREVQAASIAACRRQGASPTATVPSLLASASAWVRFGRGGEHPSVLVNLAGRSTALAVVRDGQVLQCGVAGLGAEHLDNQPRWDEWLSELREVYAHCVEGLPRSARPQRCVLLGQAVSSAEMAQRVAAALQLPAQPAEAGDALALDGLEFSAAAGAIGAALSATEDGGPAVQWRLDDSDGSDRGQAAQPTGRRGRRRLRWYHIGAAAWLLAGAIILWTIDLRRPAALGQTLQRIHQETSRRGLDRQLAIGRYLESQPPAALDVLDRAVTILPPQGLLVEYRWGRDGQTELSGLVGGEGEFLDLMKKLSALGEVDYKPAKRGEKGFRFDVRLKLAPRLPAATSPKGDQAGSPDEPSTKPTPPGKDRATEAK